MAWINALDVEGAELVARDPADPDVWFDPVEVYPTFFSLADGAVVVANVALEANGGGLPVVLEVGVRLPAGYSAANTRVSVLDTVVSITPPAADTAQLQGVLLEEGGDDLEVANMTAAINPLIEFDDATTPTEVGQVAGGDNPIILVARVALAAI